MHDVPLLPDEVHSEVSRVRDEVVHEMYHGGERRTYRMMNGNCMGSGRAP